jgi:hypothetical protein
MFTTMEATYDPHDVTRSAYEDRILGKGTYATFTIVGDGCVRDGECVTSKNYPANHGNDEACTIRGFEGRALQFERFDVESHGTCAYDALTIRTAAHPSGHAYCSTVKPDGLVPTAPIQWRTDSSVVRGGWKMCPSATAQRMSSTRRSAGAVAVAAALLASITIPIYRRRRIYRRKSFAYATRTVISVEAHAAAAEPSGAEDVTVEAPVAQSELERVEVSVEASAAEPEQEAPSVGATEPHSSPRPRANSLVATTI